jgi:hypothetical protein
MAARGHGTGDEAIRTTPEEDPAAGLEGMPRMDMGVLETTVPELLDLAVTGPLVLTREGREAFVLLPLDAYRRLWSTAPRPPVIDGRAE